MKMLVTGSSGGIGAAVKTAALARSYEVFELNRADWGEVADRVADWVRSGIRFDAVVFATGSCPVRPVALTSDELLDETFRINCGLFQRLVRSILENRAYSAAGMKVVAISSVSATEGWCGGAAYCASKGALSALCRAMDAELRRKGISVIAVEPRYVRTRMFADCAGRMGVPESQAEPSADFAERLLAEHFGN